MPPGPDVLLHRTLGAFFLPAPRHSPILMQRTRVAMREWLGILFYALPLHSIQEK
jgi:hypothetical protein